jgi:hypothetical protein
MKRKFRIAAAIWFCASTACIAAEATGSANEGTPRGTTYDLVVVEATPPGIAMSVRAAREGLRVLLVNHNSHLGGMLTSGLGAWDSLYEGRRSPIYDEVREAIFSHYREIYGKDSPQYRDSQPTSSGHGNGKFEPHVAEKILTDLVAREPNIEVLKGYIPSAVERNGALLRSVTFRAFNGAKTVQIDARIFADCSYEGDLAAVAKVPYRVGRESRSEYGEPHAGQIFMRGVKEIPSARMKEVAALHATLNLRHLDGPQVINEAAITGKGDGNVQAFNYRTPLTTDPANRIPIEKPSDYDPEFLKTLSYTSLVKAVPNQKFLWNRPQLIGVQQAYVEGDWAGRQKAMDAHWNATLGLLYFLQNDPSVPEETRKTWREMGLAKDEFRDNGGRPYEIYVREARRIVGRSTFTEHDATLAPGLQRAPIHPESIAISEWYLDTHGCTLAKADGSLEEGKMMLQIETFPGQISYLTILPGGVDNLLVPVCLSASHVAWGTIRLEPTWMNIAESAAFAAAQAIKQKQSPAQIDIDQLQRTLAKKRVMISFFNDIDLASSAGWLPAIQYFGTKGFFPDYNARPDSPLTPSVARIWIAAFGKIKQKDFDANAVARSVADAKQDEASEFLASQFLELLPEAAKKTSQSLGLNPAKPITRGDACRLLFALGENR